MGLTTGTQEIIGDKTFTGKVKLRGNVEFKRVKWLEITSFENSWVNGSQETAGYYKDPMGFVHVKGVVKDGTIGIAAFTLPTGYRPSKDNIFAVDSNGAFGSVYVRSTGEVDIEVGNNTYVSLCGITFYAG